MSEHSPDEKIFKFKDAMRRLQVCRSTLYRLMWSGQISYYKIGNTYRFYESDLQALIVARSPEEPKQKPSIVIAPQTEQAWAKRRMAHYINDLVEAEQPPTEAERQQSRDEWYELGEDAVIEAWQYLSKKRREALA